jgi:hypothetical protein
MPRAEGLRYFPRSCFEGLRELATESVKRMPSLCELDMVKKERVIAGPMGILAGQNAVDTVRLLHPTSNKVCISQYRYTQICASSVCVVSYTVLPRVTGIQVMKFRPYGNYET